jgi:putative ABC transport system permease protein
MKQWLGTFIYRTSMPLWIFGLVCLITLLMALMTTGIQSLRAASLNPVDIIKEE